MILEQTMVTSPEREKVEDIQRRNEILPIKGELWRKNVNA
jgi:hypothetical protein